MFLFITLMSLYFNTATSSNVYQLIAKGKTMGKWGQLIILQWKQL